MMNIQKMTSSELKKGVIKIMAELSHKEGKAVLFHDAVKMTAISLHNALNMDESLEEEYARIAKKYSKGDMDQIGTMVAMICLLMEKSMGDILGELYMEMQLGNEDGGQFFSPYAISRLSAKFVYNDSLKTKEKIYIDEPACGSGSMIIAYAEELESHGINYQERLYVKAEDIDIKAVFMTYFQLSILGIKAIVKQKDAVNGDEWLTLKTPELLMEEMG